MFFTFHIKYYLKMYVLVLKFTLLLLVHCLSLFPFKYLFEKCYDLSWTMTLFPFILLLKQTNKHCQSFIKSIFIQNITVCFQLIVRTFSFRSFDISKYLFLCLRRSCELIFISIVNTCLAHFMTQQNN